MFATVIIYRLFGRVATGCCDSDDATDSGAVRLEADFVPNAASDGIAVTLWDVDDTCPVDPEAAIGIAAFAMRLIAATCESDCILCCCSTGTGAPVED